VWGGGGGGEHAPRPPGTGVLCLLFATFRALFYYPIKSPLPTRIIYESLVSETDFTMKLCYPHEISGGHEIVS